MHHDSMYGMESEHGTLILPYQLHVGLSCSTLYNTRTMVGFFSCTTLYNARTMVDQMLIFFSGIARPNGTTGLVLGVSKGEAPTTPADTSKGLPDLVRRPILCRAFRTVKLRWLTVVDLFFAFFCAIHHIMHKQWLAGLRDVMHPGCRLLVFLKVPPPFHNFPFIFVEDVAV